MQRPSVRWPWAVAVLSLLTAGASAYDLIGQPARTVHVLGLFAGGVGAGAALARARDRTRAARTPSGPGDKQE